MATRGKTKFDKYFAGRQINTFIRHGYGQVRCYGDQLSVNAVIALMDGGTKITVLPMEQYHSKYKVAYGSSIGYVSEQYISKPKNEKGSTELLEIKTNELASRGHLSSLSFEDTITTVRGFDNRFNIQKSIIGALKSNKQVGREIVEDVEHIFRFLPRKFVWNAAIDRHEVDELGKYIGELLFGSIILLNKTFDGHKIVGVSIPDDSTHSGIDSFLHVKGGDIIGISSKYGVGARASFFRNILDKIQPTHSLMPPCVLTRLCHRYKNHTREAIYNYAIKDILGLNIENPYKIFDPIRTGRYQGYENVITEIVVAVQERLMASTPDSTGKLIVRNKIYQNLPYSITNYFCRLIATQLNECPVSMEIIRDVLSRSPIYQVHLDHDQWVKGNIRFDAYHVKSAGVKIIGSKSSIEDIHGKQGLLNYELRTDTIDKFEVLPKAAS